MERPANDDEPDRLVINDADLQAYVRGELGAVRRRRVEGYLACNPDLAAEVMSNLHRSAVPVLRRRIRVVPVGVGLAACLLSGFAGSWISTEASARWREADGDVAPTYVEEAVESQQATMLRAIMTSQVKETRLDPDEIRTRMRISLPTLPPGWRVRDVQVYPSDAGPGVNLWLEAPGARRFNLFAVRANTWTGSDPQAATDGARTAAFWEVGPSAYVLLGDGSRHELLADAKVLSGNTTL